MPSPFDAIDAALQAHVDRLFGEGVRIIPQAGDLNYSTGADPQRPHSVVRATVARAPLSGRPGYKGTAANGASQTSVPAEIWISQETYAGIKYTIERGDLVELIDETPAPRFTVASVHAGDGGDVQIILG